MALVCSSTWRAFCTTWPVMRSSSRYFGFLLMLPLLGSHPLDLLHAAASATGAIGKALDTVGKLVMEFFDQTSNGADRVPQQGPIGRVMNVGFHYRGVDAEFLAVFQTELDGRLNYGLVDRFQRGRRRVD